MAEEVKHYQVEQRYRIVIERAAVKGLDGFKVEANGDNISEVQDAALHFYNYAKETTLEKGEKDDQKESKRNA